MSALDETAEALAAVSRQLVLASLAELQADPKVANAPSVLAELAELRRNLRELARVWQDSGFVFISGKSSDSETEEGCADQLLDLLDGPTSKRFTGSWTSGHTPSYLVV